MQLAEGFTARINHKYKSNDEVRLIFDRYDLLMCLKTATRVKRQAGQDHVYYRISNSTHIVKVPMRKLLSHSKTKKELSSYLAEEFLDHAVKTNLRVVVAWGCQCRATHQNVNHLQSDQEEADTKMLLHAWTQLPTVQRSFISILQTQMF